MFNELFSSKHIKYKLSVFYNLFLSGRENTDTIFFTSDQELLSFSWSGQELTEQRDMGKRKKKVRLDNRDGRRS